MSCGEPHADHDIMAFNAKMKTFWFEKLNIQYSLRM